MKSQPQFKFRLYVAGQGINSVKARANLTNFCAKHIQTPYNIEVIDVFDDTARALKDGILITPTLFVTGPAFEKQIVGNLGDAQTILSALELAENSS